MILPKVADEACAQLTSRFHMRTFLLLIGCIHRF